MDFHHQLKGAILDAVDEGLISRDPTRKAIIKGKTPRGKKDKYLNQFELQKLIEDLEGTNIEVYKVSLPKERKPSKWVTEIFVPIKKRVYIPKPKPVETEVEITTPVEGTTTNTNQ